MARFTPLTCTYEIPFWQQNTLVVGLDEVGRGALAGPLVVGAVMFPKYLHQSSAFYELADVRDSKKLTHAKRYRLSLLIKKHAQYWGVGAVPAQVIDKVGITLSLRIATLNSINKCLHMSPTLLTDRGLLNKPLQRVNHHEVKLGDDDCLSIAAASIVAKVWRDEYMKKLGSKFPWKIYRWYENVGYASEHHRMTIKEYGPSTHHRMSFLNNLLQDDIRQHIL